MATADGYDRLAALKEFDESKTGVRGLVESGVTTIPPIFRHPHLRTSAVAVAATSPDLSIPTIDLSLPRPLAVDLIRAASRDWGFFQITNHGIPLPVLDRTIAAVRSFNELPPTERSKYYSRSTAGGVSYSSNVDLYRSSAASWRDTIQVMMGPFRAEPDRIPAACRAELLAWDEHVTRVGRAVLGMMAEGLGLGPGRFEEMTCLEGRTMACHYYPPCPEPDLTVGLADHTDPGVLTVLLQDHIGGLQVKRKGEDGECYWVDVKPLPGALVINVGDLLQVWS
ncbi:putative 1-aminocyclopropane-1-carboxylate oxidase [Cocos nucifera]|uniref:Putative 1-aminocyclopropane-1-carboxylate oxidase n=1 Tax=Cocos nucifera TaxID=13894 RepID=A0A8K0IHK8_COCNU|nr:putative 1-aminocyclopropane-1-carboxylate oxidase [Cocos nucifera]